LDQTYRGVFANTPAEFHDSGPIQLLSDTAFNPEFLMTNRGLRMKTSIYPGQDGAYVLKLHCSDSATSHRQEVGIWIKQHGGGVYSRTNAHEFATTKPGEVGKVLRVFLSKCVSVARSRDLESSHRHAFIFRKNFNELGATNSSEFPLYATQIKPREKWDSQRHTFLTHGASDFAAYGYFHLRVGITNPDELTNAEGFLLAFGKTR
jgi:hypothetical protein